MITKKARILRARINDQGTAATIEQSIEMIDELLDNCNPTPDEFDYMFYKCIVNGYTLYRLSVDGFDKKKLKDSI